MPRYLALVVVMLIAGGGLAPCGAESPPVPPAIGGCVGVATEGGEVEAVRQLELRGGRMNTEGWDVEESRSFFASDFIGIQPGGAISGLETIVVTSASGRIRGWARSFVLTDLDIRVFICATALVVGTAEARPLAAPAESPPWRIRFLNVWRKEGGRWRYWANQFTAITSEPRPAAGSNIPQ